MRLLPSSQKNYSEVITNDEICACVDNPISSFEPEMITVIEAETDFTALVEKSLISAGRRFVRNPADAVAYFFSHLGISWALDETSLEDKEFEMSMLTSFLARSGLYYARTGSASIAGTAGLSSGVGSAVFGLMGALYDVYCDTFGIEKNDADRLAFQASPTIAEGIGKLGAYFYKNPSNNPPSAPAINTENLNASEMGYSIALALLQAQHGARELADKTSKMGSWMGEHPEETLLIAVFTALFGAGAVASSSSGTTLQPTGASGFVMSVSIDPATGEPASFN